MREREILHTKFFANWAKDKFKKNLCLIDVEKEDSEIDTILKDKNSNEEIFIQSVAYRGEGLIYLKPDKASLNGVEISLDDPRIKDYLVKLVLVPTQDDKKKSIIDCIKKKEDLYPDYLQEKLVLLIETTLPSISPEDLDGYFPEGLDTNFKGIYFVQLPVTNPNTKYYKYDETGFVYELKSAFIKKSGFLKIAFDKIKIFLASKIQK